MATVQCSCGATTEFSEQSGACAICGLVNSPRADAVAVEYGFPTSELMTQPPLLVGCGTISGTMMQDLPAVTHSEDFFGHAFVAGPVAGGALAAGALAASAVVARVREEMEPMARTTHRDSKGVNRATPRVNRRRSTQPAATIAEPVLVAGQRLLDRYEILRKIGQGGMSLVYEAFDEVRDEKVAIKVLLSHLATSPRLRERFLQEGRLSSNFSHANIARVYDLHQTDELMFLSMELLQGSTLRHDMNRRRTQRQGYRPTEVLSLIEAIVRALTVVHRANVVHRDLKPENLWLTLDGSVKVMDFGIARDSARGMHTTSARGSGTPYYIAPEQLAASRTLDHRADQYSVAIIAYELLVGELPQGAITPPHLKDSAVPRKLSLAIFRALSSDPTQRFPTMECFLAAARFRTKRSPVIGMLAGVCGVAMLASGAFAFQRYGLPLLLAKSSPIWAEIAPGDVVEGQQIRFTARNAECRLSAQALRYRLMSDAPAGATLDAATGEFKWIPDESQGPRDYQFTILGVVDDGYQAPVVEEREFNVHVAESFDAPVVPVQEPTVAVEHQPLQVNLSASDPNQPAVGLRYQLVNPLPGMTIDERSGEIRWLPYESDGGSQHVIDFRVSLATASPSEVTTGGSMTIRVEEKIDPAVFISSDRLTADVAQPIHMRVVARDPNTPALGGYYRLGGGDRIGISLDPQSGQFQWTPGVEHSGKQVEVSVQYCWDGRGKTEVVGQQVLKLSVAEYDPPVEKPSPEPVAAKPVAANVAAAPPATTPIAVPAACPTSSSPGALPANCPAPGAVLGQGGAPTVPCNNSTSTTNTNGAPCSSKTAAPGTNVVGDTDAEPDAKHRMGPALKPRVQQVIHRAVVERAAIEHRPTAHDHRTPVYEVQNTNVPVAQSSHGRSPSVGSGDGNRPMHTNVRQVIQKIQSHERQQGWDGFKQRFGR